MSNQTVFQTLVGKAMSYEAFAKALTQNPEPALKSAGEGWDITAKDLEARLRQGHPIRLIDVREPHEWNISHLDQAELIPLGSLAARMDELDPTEEIVLMCRTGGRSARALDLLRTAGFRKIRNLKGGINAWAREVDPKLPVY